MKKAEEAMAAKAAEEEAKVDAPEEPAETPDEVLVIEE